MDRNFVTTADGARLAVRVTGEGPLLLLVPGLGGLGEFWAPLVAALRDRFRIVTYDHRGAGESSRTDTRYSMDDMTADLRTVLGQFANEPVTLIGHSTGGALAQRIAIEDPQRVARLVLSATWARPCAYFRRLFECRLEVLDALGIDAYARQSELFLHTPHWLATHGVRTAAESSRDVLAESILSRKIRAILTHDTLDQLHAIRCQTLVVVAADDMVTPPHLSQQMSQRILDCRFEVLPEGGHYVLHERSADYVRSIHAFLTFRSGSRAS